MRSYPRARSRSGTQAGQGVVGWCRYRAQRRKSQMKFVIAVALLALAFLPTAATQTCGGKQLRDIGGVKNAWVLDGGGIGAFARMNVNLDGYGHAYSPKNYEGGALLLLCNAGKVYLP